MIERNIGVIALTWIIQETTQVSTAVRPSALGALAVTELKMLTRTRNKVTSRAIRPGNIFVFSQQSNYLTFVLCMHRLDKISRHKISLEYYSFIIINR